MTRIARLPVLEESHTQRTGKRHPGSRSWCQLCTQTAGTWSSQAAGLVGLALAKRGLRPGYFQEQRAVITKY